jgi:hypothetical protein
LAEPRAKAQFFLEFVWFGSLFVMGFISVLGFGFKVFFAISPLFDEKVDIFYSECLEVDEIHSK